MFYIIDLYVMFVICFILFFNLLGLECYIKHKEEQEKTNKFYYYSFLENIFLNFKTCLLFVMYYLFYISQFNDAMNLVFSSKFIFLFFFIFLFYAKQFLINSRMFSFEFIITFIFSNFCLFLIMQCDNFLNFYIILESYTLTISSTILLKNFKNKTTESAFAYLILNITASLFLVYAISYIYFCTGIINFSDLDKIYIFYDVFYYKLLLNYALIILIFSFLIKLAVFPFSFFLFKIYKNLPSIHVFYFLTVPKFIILLFLFKISNFIFLILDYKFLTCIYLLLFVTSIFHSLASLMYFNFKDIIINVSLANTPFLFLFIFLKYKFFLVCFLNFMIVYFFNLFCIFYFLLFLKVKKLTNVIGLFYLNKQISFSFLVVLMSLMAIPPFSNFFTKFFMFYFLIEYKMYYYYFFLSLLNLVIVYCYISIIRVLFIKKRSLLLKYFMIKKNLSIYIYSFLVFLNIFYIFFFDIIYIIFNNLLYIVIHH